MHHLPSTQLMDMALSIKCIIIYYNTKKGMNLLRTIYVEIFMVCIVRSQAIDQDFRI